MMEDYNKKDIQFQKKVLIFQEPGFNSIPHLKMKAYVIGQQQIIPLDVMNRYNEVNAMKILWNTTKLPPDIRIDQPTNSSTELLKEYLNLWKKYNDGAQKWINIFLLFGLTKLGFNRDEIKKCTKLNIPSASIIGENNSGNYIF